MTSVRAVADDVTGACDVGAELAVVGVPVRVQVDSTVAEHGDAFWVANTQSRALDPDAARRRVYDDVRRHPQVDVLLKKIDTALRGHPGAEIEGALDALDARAAFVIAAIPAAGRLTRGGCQWFDGRRLGETEFARDPEGWGGESSVAAMLGRETTRPTVLIDLATVRDGRLAERVARHRREPTMFVVDAETDEDVARAVDGVLRLPRPVCLAGSIALVAALATHPEVRDATAAGAPSPQSTTGAVGPEPALVVCGSLHPRARAQIDALARAGLADVVRLDAAGPETVAWVGARLARGRRVALSAPPTGVRLDAAALRRMERLLADTVAAVAAAVRLRTLVLVGGETAYAVLRRLDARALAIRGRVAPLVAVGEIVDGRAAGARLVTKGGSGGAAEILVDLFRGDRGTDGPCG